MDTFKTSDQKVGIAGNFKVKDNVFEPKISSKENRLAKQNGSPVGKGFLMHTQVALGAQRRKQRQ
jgi:hypothetical protein